ncbi:MAG: ribosome maturation factor RimP [Clostridiaceae bacterium]|nr:ribosome maturation factor RimP [Clostridiaceae bacterium]
MVKRNAIEEKVYIALEAPIKEMGFELINVVYKKENGKLFLRLLVDKIGGITIDECALINEKFDSFIEEELGINNHDYFEVSSPGLDYPIATNKQFQIYKDQLMDIKLYQKLDGKKLYTGKLIVGDENHVIIEEEGSEENITFERKDIAKISRTIRFK